MSYLHAFILNFYIDTKWPWIPWNTHLKSQRLCLKFLSMLYCIHVHAYLEYYKRSVIRTGGNCSFYISFICLLRKRWSCRNSAICIRKLAWRCHFKIKINDTFSSFNTMSEWQTDKILTAPGKTGCFFSLLLWMMCFPYTVNIFTARCICISAVYAVTIEVTRCLSVCPSITFVSCAKTNKDIFEISSPSSSDTILVFPHQRGCRYSDENPPNVGVEYKRIWKIADFLTNISLYLRNGNS